MNTLDADLKRIVKKTTDSLPRWLLRLHNGENIFGKQKNKLIIAILEFGGMYDLQNKCGISLKKHSRPSGKNVRVMVLKKILTQLSKEQHAAIVILKNKKNTDAKPVSLYVANE